MAIATAIAGGPLARREAACCWRELLQERANQSAAVFPLSHGQRGLWFLHQMDRREPGVQRLLPVADPVAARLAGVPPVAVQTLVDRHPCLADDLRGARRRAASSASTSSRPCPSR